MLKMDQVQKIKILGESGLSLRGITRQTGYAFETVKKYIEKQDFSPEIRPKQKRIGKLDPYKHLIDEWLEKDKQAKRKQRHSAKRVYDRLKEIHGDEFNVSDRAVRKYVAMKKANTSQQVDGSLPLLHPGGEAQCDFGDAQFIERGKIFNGHYLNLSYPYSNAGYLQLFKSENLECLQEGLVAIFAHVGRVPSKIWFDNASTIVKKVRGEGKRDVTESFRRFELHFGFESNFCNPDSGNEKGSVENKVGYHRRNLLVPIPEFENVQVYNQELLTRCDVDMQREHYKKERFISELLSEEKALMRNLPKSVFEIYRLEKAKANNYGKVRFETNIYSSSPDLAGKEVWIKAGAFNLSILDDNFSHIQTHDRLYGKNKESMKWEPYLNLIAKRPRALKYSAFFTELPQSVKDYFDGLNYQEKKAALKVMARMVRETDMPTAKQMFKLAIEQRLKDTDSIWAAFYSLTKNNSSVEDIDAPYVVAYTPDNSIYDVCLRGGV
jgi:transposase